MKLNGYEVVFLPLERRLIERRAARKNPHQKAMERRNSERRETGAEDMPGAPELAGNTPATSEH